MAADRQIGDAHFDIYANDVYVSNPMTDGVQLCGNSRDARRVAKLLLDWAREYEDDNPPPGGERNGT